MKIFIKRAGKIVLWLIGSVAAILTFTTIYHHTALRWEADEIIANGKLVEVDGRSIHVYAEGNKKDKPTLVFLSGSGTAAPVYDFKSLYSSFLDEYRIVVVEKTGYGYSEIVKVDRDIDTLLDEVRSALVLAGENGPYVLLPHSMSGLEAIYWSQIYPDEVAAIIGLDMSVPESYDYFDFSSLNQMAGIGRASVFFGLHRIPGVYALSTNSLTDEEAKQQRLLMHRNAVNIDFVLEGKAVYDNAMKVKNNGTSQVPILLFVSDGKDIGDYWIDTQRNFAEENNAKLIQFNVGHYIHHFKGEEITKQTKDFLNSIKP